MRRYSIFGLAGALLHLVLLGLTVALILSSPQTDWSRHWIAFLALDFPVSLGVFPVAWLVPPAPGGPLRDLTNFWWPLLYHGIVGTGWWYVVGWAIERKVRRGRPGEDQESK